MSTNLNLNSIGFQTSLRSKPIRENFTDIENGVNDLQAQIDALATPPAGTEVTNARDYHSILRDRLRSGFQVFPRYMVSGGAVTQTGGGNMTVTVAAGEAVIEGIGLIWAGAVSGTITAPSTNPRWDTVVINSDNTLSIVSGSEAASPVLPTIASTQKKLAHIYLLTSTTSILTADIYDARIESSNTDFMVFEPIGTIKAWHKSFPNTPALIQGSAWKECDGSVILDPESPYASQTIPDLNGGNRFLKGASTSGTLEASANKEHNHGGTVSAVDVAHDHGGTVSAVGVPTHDHLLYYSLLEYQAGGTQYNAFGPNGATAGATGAAQNGSDHYHNISSDNANHYHNISNDGATDAVPKNMTVVWIMRIK